MKKLILKQLNKSLKKLKQIKQEVENYPEYDRDKLQNVLFDIYQFIVSEEKPLKVFVKALDDYMNNDVNKNFKLALLNEINEKLDKHEEAGLIKCPDSFDWKSIHYFKEEVSKSLISNAEYVDFAKEIKVIYDPVENILFLKKYPKHQQEIAKNIATYFSQRINAEIVIPFFDYHVKYTWIKEKKPEDKFRPAELEEYIQSWINLETTAENWLKFKNINVFEHLSKTRIADEKLEEIKQHQFRLFNEIVNNVFQNRYKTPFENLSEKEANEVAKRDLELISLLLTGNLNEANQKRVAKNFRIKDWQKAVLQFEDLLRNKYSSDNNHDIHHDDSHLNTTAVLKYKKYLEEYLKHQTNKRKNNTQDTPLDNYHTDLTFGLKPTAKPLITVIKQLCIDIDFLKENLTTPEELTKVLSDKKLNECNKEIHFNCQTQQLSYIIDKLKPYFKNFTPATIEESGLFFTRKGAPLKAQNLYSNRTDKPQEKAKIDNVFQHFQ